MPDDFDHYYKWLGIPPADQPPNHYRLLGLPNFTDDPEVIANAADQRAVHLRTFQLGQRSARSQQVLNEVARARVCLMNPETKAAYDTELRRQLAEQQIGHQAAATANLAFPLPNVSVAEPATLVAPATNPVNVNKSDAGTKDVPRKGRRTPQPKNSVLEAAKVIVGGVTGLAIGYVLICWISPRNDFLGLMGSKESKPLASSVEIIPSHPSPSVSIENSEPATIPTAPDDDSLASVEGDPPSDAPPEPMVDSPAATPAEPEPHSPTTPSESDEERRQRLTAERETALANRDIRSALRAMESLSAVDDSGALDQKLEFVKRLHDSATTTGDLQLVAEYLLRLLEQAISEEKTDLAERYADQLIAGARKAGDADLIRWATLCVLKMRQK